MTDDLAPRCSWCGETGTFNWEHDAYFCVKCGVWIGLPGCATTIPRNTTNKRVPHCSKCGESGAYNLEHDAYFCVKCGIWIERECGDPDCTYCANRPPEPKKEG